jgi:hypothetical protein
LCSVGVLALLFYLQYQEIVNVKVNLDKIQTAEVALSSITAPLAQMIPADNNNLLIMDGNHCVPLTGSIASGFIFGLTREG